MRPGALTASPCNANTRYLTCPMNYLTYRARSFAAGGTMLSARSIVSTQSLFVSRWTPPLACHMRRTHLAGGGSAIVYRGIDTRGQREVALKVTFLCWQYALTRCYLRHVCTDCDPLLSRSCTPRTICWTRTSRRFSARCVLVVAYRSV